MFTSAIMKDPRDRWLHAVAALAFVSALVPGLSLQAQSLDNPDTIDAIVGSPIQEEERTAANNEDRIIAAIEKAPESAALVRKTTNVDKVDIVFLADSTAMKGGLPAPIEKVAAEHKDELTALRNEVEGNAILYHAINSRHVLMRDIVAVEFNDPRNVIVYAAAKPAD
jgi:hypothetical protein